MGCVEETAGWCEDIIKEVRDETVLAIIGNMFSECGGEAFC
jgi:hypothetical protein